MGNYKIFLSGLTRWLLATLLWLASTGGAFAYTQSAFVTFTLEGCRNDGTITLPISGKFICPDAAYTTGNLGKGWNELDLVPHRLTTSLGGQSGATTDYNVYVAGDNLLTGKVGWDVVTVPIVNTAKSDASCSVSAGSQSTQGDAGSPFGGGVDTVIYRQWTIHQAKNTTCVFDWTHRLALGSHLYSGSSLQSYMFEQEGLTGSKKTISIPVNEILPQSLSKDMSASQGSDHAWNVTKSATTNTLAFGDVCAADAPTSLPLSITVSWTKFAATPGGPITVITNVYATNPSARVIDTNVTDVIYSGTTPLNTSPTVTKSVPANTSNYLMLTHTYTAPAGTTDLNDIATATYTDNVTQVPVPGTTTATASASVQNTGPELNASASIADLESLTGNGLTFSVAAPSLGSFLNYPTPSDPAYVADAHTTGPVAWGVTGQTSSGSVTFDKTVYLNGKLITTGVLSDVATLAGIDGFAATAGPLSANISSSATAKLTINKSYSGLVLAAGEKLVFNFHVSRTGDATYGADTSITMSGATTSGSTTLSGLTLDTYLVEEKDTVFYPSGCNDASCALVVAIQDTTGPQRTVHLEAVDGVATCSGIAAYHDEPQLTQFPTAQVQKITVPSSSGSWTFTLKGPSGNTLDTQQATANAGYVDFGPLLTEDGTYTVVETTQTGWDLTSALPNDGVTTTICSFTVNFPQDLQHAPFQCTFTNTQRGKAQVIKTVQGNPPSGTLAFTFQLRQGATTTTSGSTLESLIANAGNGGTLNFSTYLVPGSTYQMCEIVMPGWTTTLGTFVPNSFVPPDGVAPNPAVDNSILCGNFTVTPGQTFVFTIDNAPPPGGRALTIGFWKNWASCKKSGGNQAPVLDQTMAKAEPTGIRVDSFYLHGSTATPNVAPDCAKAVSLLSKQNYAGVNKASDPLFNMAAQLVGAELNLAAGAYTCPQVASAINQANALLTKYAFNGTGYTGKLSAADATLANSLATRLDNYNNDRPAACQ